MRTLYNLPDGDVEDINKKVASQSFEDDAPSKSYLTISQVCPFRLGFRTHVTSKWRDIEVTKRGMLMYRRQTKSLQQRKGSRTPSIARSGMMVSVGSGRSISMLL
jgi:hypothetical protein